MHDEILGCFILLRGNPGLWSGPGCPGWVLCGKCSFKGVGASDS